MNLTAALTAVLPIGPLPGAVPALLECGAAAGALPPGAQPRSFADLLAAAEPGDGIAVPEAGVTVSADGLDVPAWAEMPMPQNCAEPGPAEPPAVAQPWAWVLVPELANLPALPPPEYAAPVGDSIWWQAAGCGPSL